MKHLKRILALLLVMVALVGTVPLQANAAANFETIQSGQTIAIRNTDAYQRPYYRIKVDKDCVLKISWTGHIDQTTVLNFYKSSSMDGQIGSFKIEKSKGTCYAILKKGTTYFKMYEKKGAPSTKVTFTVMSPSKFKGTNTAKSKAISLKPNTYVEVAKMPGKDYWFKIKLTKSQYLHFYKSCADLYAPDIVIYDSKFKEIDYTCFGMHDKKDVPDVWLTPGTYYLRVADLAWKNMYVNGYIKFKWK